MLSSRPDSTIVLRCRSERRAGPIASPSSSTRRSARRLRAFGHLPLACMALLCRSARLRTSGDGSVLVDADVEHARAQMIGNAVMYEVVQQDVERFIAGEDLVGEHR